MPLEPVPNPAIVELQRLMETLAMPIEQLQYAAPALMQALDDVVLKSDHTALIDFSVNTAKFVDKDTLYKLVYSACTVYAKRFSQQYGRDELSNVLTELNRAKADVRDALQI
jgi:hypothetical protein